MIGSDYTGSYKSKNTRSRQPSPRLVFVAIYRYVNLKSFFKTIIIQHRHSYTCILSYYHHLMSVFVVPPSFNLSYCHHLMSVFVVPPSFILSYCHHLMSVFVIRPSFNLSYCHHLTSVFVVGPSFILSFCRHLTSVFVVPPRFILSYCQLYSDSQFFALQRWRRD